MGFNVLFAHSFRRSLDRDFLPTGPWRIAAIEHVEHVRGLFSGPQRPEDRYWSFTGEDTTQPRRITIPPGSPSLKVVIAQAAEYLWHDAPDLDIQLALDGTLTTWGVLNRSVPRDSERLHLLDLYIKALRALLVARTKAARKAS